MYISEQDYLMHYGVKGMKWGVRRYERSGGSYTQRGLKRYREREQRYNEATERYKKAKKSGNRAEVRNAKNERKAAKYKLDRAYKGLKQDKLADEGKALYSRGKTITDGSRKAALGQGLVLVGSSAANKLLSQYGGAKAATISRGIFVGGTALNAAMQIKSNYNNKRLRAYYGHSYKAYN